MAALSRPTSIAHSDRARTRRHAAVEESLDSYFREISAYPLTTRDEEAALARRIRVGDQGALDELVRSNLRFVVSVAKKYQNQGVSLSDLINEGNLGLIRAAHRFDETKGVKFISYAVWWIRQAVLEGLAEQSRPMRVPLNQVGTIGRIGRRANTLLQRLGREATPAEIADGMGLSADDVARLAAVAQPWVSLDAPTLPGEDGPLLDRLADEHGCAADDLLLERALADAVAGALVGLKGREAKILRLYFGLDGGEPMTLQQIGALLGITRERVRQIKEAALDRLRHPARSAALASFRD